MERAEDCMGSGVEKAAGEGGGSGWKGGGGRDGGRRNVGGLGACKAKREEGYRVRGQAWAGREGR